MLSKVFVHSPTKQWLECAYSLVHEEILKYLHCRIVTYPLDKVIRPLNNWGQNSKTGQPNCSRGRFPAYIIFLILSKFPDANLII